MVNFAELKAKAEKAKDASVTTMTNTRDRFSSVPSSKTNWDPNWKRAPPPTPHRGTATSALAGASTSGPPLPSRARPDVGTVPPVPSASRPGDDLAAPPPYAPPPPPTRAASGYPPSHRETSHDALNRIDWTNLSPEDKEAFFGWLDEFFSRYLGIELSPRAAPPSVSATLAAPRTRNARLPPTVNMLTRPPI